MNQILGVNGTPMTSDQARLAAQQRMADLMQTVIASFAGKQVQYQEGADIGLNLILNCLKMQPSPQDAVNTLTVMLAALDQNGRAVIHQMRQSTSALLRANPQEKLT